MSGKQNEDRYGVSASYTDAASRTPSLLAVVADGIGGHQAGEVAAELAVETISRLVSQSDATDPLTTLQNAIILASQVISDKSETGLQFQGMGSTVACAWVIGVRLYTAAVGDSRIYLVRDHAIHQLTTDHTWVREAIDQGALTPEEARNHPNAHIIRRYLGSRNGVIPDLRLKLNPAESDASAEANQGIAFKPGDVLLLCSDGLTDLVTDDEILATVDTRGVQDGLDEMVHLANLRGGHDNITIVTLRVPLVDQPALPLKPRRPISRRRIACLTVVGLGLILVIAVSSLAWYFNRSSPALTLTETMTPVQTTLLPTLPPSLAPPSASPSVIPATELPLTPTSPGEIAPSPNPATLTPWPTNTALSP
jgi:protein phosphatase